MCKGSLMKEHHRQNTRHSFSVLWSLWHVKVTSMLFHHLMFKLFPALFPESETILLSYACDNVTARPCDINMPNVKYDGIHYTLKGDL